MHVHVHGDNALFSKIELKLGFYFMLLRNNLYRRGVAQGDNNIH